VVAAALLVVTVAVASWVSGAVERRFASRLQAWTSQRVRALASRAVLAALAEVGRGGQVPLVSYRADEFGRLVAVEYNWVAIHGVAARAAFALDRWLQEREQQEWTLPLGEVMGLRALGGWGPRVRVRMVVSGSFEAQPFSEFYAAGFNQTVHRLGLDLRVRVLVVAPLLEQPVEVAARVPLAENQLLGPVPQWLWTAGPGTAAPGPAGGAGAAGAVTRPAP